MAFLSWDQAAPLLGLSGNAAQSWYQQNSKPQQGEAVHSPVPVSTDPQAVSAGNGIHTGLIPVISNSQNTGGSSVNSVLSNIKASNWFQSVLTAVFMLVLLFSMSTLAIAQPAPLGPMGNLPFSQLNVATDTASLVPSQMVGLLVGTPTAGATYTTPTATQLCALFPFVGASNATSFSWLFVVKNTSAGANTITLAGGTGVTLSGTGTAAQNTVRLFMIEVRGCGGTPAALLYSLNTGSF